MPKLPSVTTITSGYTSAQALNDNFEALKDAFNNTVSRDGSTPNSMSSDFDLNSFDLINGGTVQTDRFILNGTLMTPSGVDPVFAGTVSAFGAGFISEPDAAAGRNALALGTLATQDITYVNTNVEINDANWSGSDLEIVNGGTGASSVGAARTNLGLGSAATTDILDEDDMVSNSATDVPSQQSTKAYVDTSISSLAIGVNQTWQQPTRAYDITYQNTTGRPIMVAIDDDGGTAYFQISTDGTNWDTMYTWAGGTGSYERNHLSVIIPDQLYYRVSGGNGVGRWWELR